MLLCPSLSLSYSGAILSFVSFVSSRRKLYYQSKFLAKKEKRKLTEEEEPMGWWSSPPSSASAPSLGISFSPILPSRRFRTNTYSPLPSSPFGFINTTPSSIRFRNTTLGYGPRVTPNSTRRGSSTQELEQNQSTLDCLGTGQDVECLVTSQEEEAVKKSVKKSVTEEDPWGFDIWESVVLVSPFFFWGTAMVAMKEVLPKSGPFFVSSFRLIPAGLLLVAFAAYKGRPFPAGFNAWLSISLFALIDASCFQGFLAEGLQKTSAGLGSVIIDSQPLTVAVLAALLFGESIGVVGAAGLVLGVVGLLLLEVPALAYDESNLSLWGSGELWMLLAAQSMAVGTVMVRWVSKYSDPVMATGWHMVIGGLPLAVISILNHDPALSGSVKEFTSTDILALLYTSIFGSAVSYGVFFYSATKGSLTKLSSLTFLTPMFASVFGFFYLGETFSPMQLVGAAITVLAIYMVNFRNSVE